MYCAPTEEATQHRSFLSHTITHPSVLHGLVCAHARFLTSGLHRHSIVLTQRRPHSIVRVCPTPSPTPQCCKSLCMSMPASWPGACIGTVLCSHRGGPIASLLSAPHQHHTQERSSIEEGALPRALYDGRFEFFIFSIFQCYDTPG